MFTTLALGSMMMLLTVVVESVFIATAIAAMNRFGPRLVNVNMLLRMIVLLSSLALWLMAAISAALWMWALLFFWLGEFDTIRQAIYFSTVSATTLGFGDVLLSERWQLLSGFIAANGLVMFSLNTAFLFDVLQRLERASREADAPTPQETGGARQP
ncbi:MAG: ion channel [Pseudomonadota bacterium]